MVEGARLESVCAPKAYRGFESLPLCFFCNCVALLILTKKGLFIKKKNTQQKMEIKKPLEINYDDSIENITKQIGFTIHQDISQKVIR